MTRQLLDVIVVIVLVIVFFAIDGSEGVLYYVACFMFGYGFASLYNCFRFDRERQ